MAPGFSLQSLPDCVIQAGLTQAYLSKNVFKTGSQQLKFLK